MTRATPVLLGFLLLAPAGAAPLSASNDPSQDKTIIVRDGEVVRLDDEDGPVIVRAEGRARRGYIGVRPIEMTPDLRAHFGASRDAGVLVGEVEADGPAAKAGLQVGDVIAAVDGETIDSGSELARAVRRKKDGDKIQLDVIRARSKKTLTVAVAEHKGAEIALNELPRVRENRFTVPMPEVDLHFPRSRDMDRLNDRLEELEKRLKELEKRLPSK